MDDSDRKPRRPPRIELNETAVLVGEDGSPLPVSMIDVSSAGFRLRSDEIFVVGEKLRLRTSDGREVWVEIRWTRGSEAGGEFLDGPDAID